MPQNFVSYYKCILYHCAIKTKYYSIRRITNTSNKINAIRGVLMLAASTYNRLSLVSSNPILKKNLWRKLAKVDCRTTHWTYRDVQWLIWKSKNSRTNVGGRLSDLAIPTSVASRLLKGYNFTYFYLCFTTPLKTSKFVNRLGDLLRLFGCSRSFKWVLTRSCTFTTSSYNRLSPVFVSFHT